MPLYPPDFIEPCLPTISRTAPTGRQWAYEIKHDGFRFLAVRQHQRVRVYSRNGHDWSAQLPGIIEAMQALPVRSAVLDGEGVICGPDGKSDFDRMRAMFGRQGSREAFLYAFDLRWRWLADHLNASCGDPTTARKCLLLVFFFLCDQAWRSGHMLNTNGFMQLPWLEMRKLGWHF